MQACERETCIAYSDDDTEVHIFSCIRKDITAMKKKSQFSLIREGEYADGTLWAEFCIERGDFDVARGARSKRTTPMSEEQRQAAAARLRTARARKDTDGE